MQRLLTRWGFILAGVLFFVATYAPLLAGGEFKAAFFVLAMAFLVLGMAIASKRTTAPPNV